MYSSCRLYACIAQLHAHEADASKVGAGYETASTLYSPDEYSATASDERTGSAKIGYQSSQFSAVHPLNEHVDTITPVSLSHQLDVVDARLKYV